MKAPGLFERMDDWINPIVVKELRQAVQSRLVVTALFLYLGVQVFILGVFLMVDEVRAVDGINWTAGATIFPVLQGILLFTCMALIPAYTSVRLSAERSDTNVDLLFISTLRPRSIIAGKFLAAGMLALLAFSACAPFMTFAYLLRGLDMPTILLMLGIDVLGVVFGTQVGLFIAAVPTNRALKVILSFAGFVGLAVLFFAVLSGTTAMMRFGVDLTEARREEWLVIAAVPLAILCLTGLLFCWTVALVSPPSANRAPAGRAFLVATLVASGAFAAYASTSLPGPGLHGPVAIWCVLAVMLSCLQLVISTNERVAWGPRVARTIPRNPLLRLPALLFYSGAAGGTLLALGLVGLALLANEAWRAWHPAMAGAEDSEDAARFAVLFVLYVYCYAQSAVLLRTYVLGAQVARQLTWVVMMLLIGVGSAIPYLIAYLFFAEQMRHRTGTEWWQVTNPFVALAEVLGRSRSQDFLTWAFGFTSGWAVLVTLLSGHWLFRQVRRFKPLARRQTELVAVELVEPPAAPEPAPAPPGGATSIQTG
jgi:hypothetical protein